MRIALIAPPFIPVPPTNYGGTELFIGHLAVGLKKLGHDVVVYTNGEATIPVERRWLYPKSEWPIKGEVYDSMKDMNHTAWAVRDAAPECDLIHLNNAPGLVHSRFVANPFVYTIHHPQHDGLSSFYCHYPDVRFVTISHFQRHREKLLRHVHTIYHGLDFSKYRLTERKQPYVAFIGRIAPVKGTHLAIAAAKKAGIPLKIAGEVQPLYRKYFENEVKPHVDGKSVEYVGQADLAAKNELLGNALAMLFPIQWDEPFGLVMTEAMACGTPVLAMPGGSVPEIVKDGVSGFLCQSPDEIAARIHEAGRFVPREVRAYAEREFSLEHMVHQYADLYSNIIGQQATQQAIA